MKAFFPVTIYHNPKCGTSRNALEMVCAAGIEPKVVEYLQTGWEIEQLKIILKDSGLKARDLLRTKGDLAGELGLLDANVPDGAILEAMVAHPVLVERPIVVTPKGTKLCRPADVVVSLLEMPS